MEEYLERMKEIARRNPDSPCVTHDDADTLLCEILRKHGYNEIVDIFEDMTKWYS